MLQGAIAIFKAKAPVCLCRPSCSPPVSMCGPQRKVYNARTVLNACRVEFPDGTGTAISHAMAGEGREEFDALMKGWRP